MRLRLIIITVIILFSLGVVNVYLYITSTRLKEIAPLLDKQSSQLVGEVYYPESETAFKPKYKEGFLLFVSRGKVRSQKLLSASGEEAGELSILDALVINQSKKIKNIKVIVQASFAGKNTNIFSTSLQEIVRKKNLSIEVGSEVLSNQSLEKLFPKDSLWKIHFSLEPLDLKDPDVDPNLEFNKFFLEFEKNGIVNYQELNQFISSGLKSNYNKPLFPFVIIFK